ncbi:energy-coupling factor transporter transmembrane component T family protein [Crocosphaera sp. XPORK-15E]|uniref:energy-coupling factor transporter transmembrane component T family protein n=1 Tax=Crocosphaera sp. XPORK-15E TaxID=3110247 RepID=UPI002B203067|nr:CbiQ family ECF transporter T component [Crocosphaera sp. XPORK-15E]MEA5532546.1 CbiQ family ECF transporter T component [Crocosphaera sp. XPORK-15E]
MDLLRSLPIGLYLEKPLTWLHKLDPRVKLIWLMSFLLAPILCNSEWRLVLVGLLIILTLMARIPLRVWRQQMGWLIMLSILVFLITALTPDGLAVTSQPRLLESDLSLPQPTSYSYVLLDKKPLFITRHSLDLGIRISTLIFLLIYSTNLYLLTTAPEEITAGLEDLLEPLRRFKIPITEITLTLTLSLRFIPLVLEEVQNLIRSIRTRAINWQKLGIKRSLQVWLVVVEKLLENLLMRAEEIAIAMEVRGFTSPNEHRVQWHQLSLIQGDWIALGMLIPFWYARFILG